MAKKKKSKKFNPRPKIDYPPVPTRPWVPPYLRPKKRRKPKYEKPPGITQPLVVSNLFKIWHKFRILEDRIVLCGHFSEAHKRFLPRTNGFQTPCNCVVAIILAKFRRVAEWTSYTVDDILLLGDNLYLESTKHLECKRVTRITLDQVFDSFFLGDLKITITLKGTVYKGKLFPNRDDTPYLQNVVKDFFNDKYQAGIIEVQNKFIAFWQSGTNYYLFDPSDHDYNGHPWTSVRGLGFAVVMRLVSMTAVVDIIHENVDARVNSEFVIRPCAILRTGRVNLVPPPAATVVLEHCRSFPHDSHAKFGPTKYQPRLEEEIDAEPEQVIQVIEPEPMMFQQPDEQDEFSPDAIPPPAEGEQPRKAISKAMIPVERPKPESVTHFECLIYEKVGILRASTHQQDERFTRQRNGVQSVANAYAALTMLRIYKSKLWIRKILDEVLILGEQIYKESMLELPRGEKLKVTNVCHKFTLRERDFSTKVIEEYAAVGRLQSRKDDVLDLKPALEDFFRSDDMCIISGPLTLAVWLEDNYYYAFDPNERDKNGLALIKYLQVGSDLQVLDVLPGVACVMWFKRIKDLVDVYMNNVEKSLRQEPFVVSKVEINDYVWIPDKWYNFEGVSQGKWILRATFNQNDRRFDRDSRNTQCTAMSCMALAYSKIKHVKRWNRDDVDEVLLQGDALYKASVEDLHAAGTFVDPKLLVDEVQKTFKLEGKQARLDVADCMFNGMLDARDNNDVLDLRRALVEFFRDFDTGVVTSRGISIGIWKNEEIYYYFDSHSRDDTGIIKPFGTACVLRILTLEDLAKAIETNLGAGTDNLFNVSKVAVKIWEIADDGMIKPPLNNYTEVDELRAILRASLHERSADFKLNRGKQTVPMCLAAAGMIGLYPCSMWTRDIVDEILKTGDKLYEDTMIKREQTPALPESDDIDEVYAENCLMNYSIGINKFKLAYEQEETGNFMHHFTNAMSDYVKLTPKDEEDLKPLLIASDVYTVLVWFANDIYYIFDPKPRDETGQVYGKEEWSLLPVGGEGEEEDNEDVVLRITEMEGGGDGTLIGPVIDEMNAEQRKSVASQANDIASAEGQSLPVKHSVRYWREQEEAGGKALAMWFAKPDKMIEHIIENVPITKREEMVFKMLPVRVENVPETKSVYDPQEGGKRTDNYAGDWYAFKEIDHGKWILRGSTDLKCALFPSHNRGRQSVAMAYVALGYVNHYALSKFKVSTVDDILKYGDRLHSASRMVHYKEIKSTKSLKIKEEEIEYVLNSMSYGVEDIARSFCVARDQTHLEVTPDFVKGDLKGRDATGVLDVPEALAKYFEENRYCLLSSKGITVAVWRGAKVLYMFDPYSRGACGSKCPNGEACITRFLDLQQLANLFVNNVPREGKNVFTIHRVEMRVVSCPADYIEDVPEPEEPTFDGFVKVMPGKRILTGTINAEDARFGRTPGAPQSAAIAVIALTMTLVHKASLWTKPNIDDIIVLGDELYQQSIDRLGYAYNPWETSLTLKLINRDYTFGSLQANCEPRTMDQRGIIEIKHPKILNLRQGIDRFFEENTHGVVETETLTVAIWEEEDLYPHPNIIYMFDPKARGPSGMPQTNGAACVVTFESAELVAEHIVNCITDTTKRYGDFVITPVEIVVGDRRTQSKTLDPCKQRAKDLPKLCPDECEKKRLRKLAAEERKRKKDECEARVGRHAFYELQNGDAVLRGTRSQNSKKYSECSRGNQDIPNCLAAFVVNRLVTINRWHYKHIDMVLDVGDTLYKDSYVNYSPQDIKLGFKNVLRKVFVKDVRVTVNIYKPAICKVLNPANLEMVLTNYFQQETFGILNVYDEYVAVFFKEGMYYIFDPHERDVEGDAITKQGQTGWACIIRFPTITSLAQKYVANVMKTYSRSSIPCFVLTLVTIGNIVKMEPN